MSSTNPTTQSPSVDSATAATTTTDSNAGQTGQSDQSSVPFQRLPIPEEVSSARPKLEECQVVIESAHKTIQDTDDGELSKQSNRDIMYLCGFASMAAARSYQDIKKILLAQISLSSNPSEDQHRESQADYDQACKLLTEHLQSSLNYTKQLKDRMKDSSENTTGGLGETQPSTTNKGISEGNTNHPNLADPEEPAEAIARDAK